MNLGDVCCHADRDRPLITRQRITPGSCHYSSEHMKFKIFQVFLIKFMTRSVDDVELIISYVLMIDGAAFNNDGTNNCFVCCQAEYF